jgi:hypothetical protein
LDSKGNNNNNPANDESNDLNKSEEEILKLLKPQNQPKSVDQPTRTLQYRSQIKPPEHFGFHHYYEPNTFESAICCADKTFWKTAIKKEVNSIENYQV